MFSSRTRGRKAFAVEQKIREFKKIYLKAKDYRRQRKGKA